MITGRHRHKLIDGLVIAMGKPSGGGSSSKPDYPAEEEPSDDDADPEAEGSAEEERTESSSEEDDEATKCARDIGGALGIDDLDDRQARQLVEAIRTIAGK